MKERSRAEFAVSSTAARCSRSAAVGPVCWPWRRCLPTKACQSGRRGNLLTHPSPWVRPIPLLPLAPHFPARAKSRDLALHQRRAQPCRYVGLQAGTRKADGQDLPNFDKQTGFFKNQVGGLMKSPWPFRQHGQCGKWVSDLFPHLAQPRRQDGLHPLGLHHSNNHCPALFMMNTGFPRMGFPCVGSWVTYGLGSESRDLPAFCVMSDPPIAACPRAMRRTGPRVSCPGSFREPISGRKAPRSTTSRDPAG